MAKEDGWQLITYVNQDGLAKGINPFASGSGLHTDVMKTQALRQALDLYGFDAAIGVHAATKKSHAKERVFSFRSAEHRWDPKSQRPELWRLYNARKHPKESIRVFPLSNWTELDVWQYIYLEQIPIVPLCIMLRRVQSSSVADSLSWSMMIGCRSFRGSSDDQESAVSDAGLLSADRGDRKRSGHAACDHSGNAADDHVGAAGQGD